MAKVTSKLQVTIPKRLAEQFGIHPGDEVEWTASADAIRLSPGRGPDRDKIQARLALFDQAMKRHRSRKSHGPKQPADRGWKRQELYTRGRPH
jgi:AbrB family looped-hinge helix DNA binding protein